MYTHSLQDKCLHSFTRRYRCEGVSIVQSGDLLTWRWAELALAAVIVLAAAGLLCVLRGQVFEDQGGAPLRELVGVGVQAAGTGHLQELLPELGRVSLQDQQQASATGSSHPRARARHRRPEGHLEGGGVVGHGASHPLIAAVLLDVGDPVLTLTHDLCPLQVEVLVDHLQSHDRVT